jgi:glycosyltransferase involved in cell wall biosynthesis
MVLGIDGRLANEERRAGVGVVCTEVLRALQHLSGEVQLRIYLDERPRSFFPLHGDAAEFTILPKIRFWTHRALGRELKNSPPDAFWSPVFSAPNGARCRCIATVHDLAFLTFKEHFTWRKRVEAVLQARHAARKAAHFIAISESTKSDLTRLMGVPETKISVAPLGCARAFSMPMSPIVAESTLRKHKISMPYVLYVGRIQPRKNLVRLIEAFEMVLAKHPKLPHRLVIAGEDGWMPESTHAAAGKSPVRDRIIFTGFFPEQELPALISAADALVLVSLWEGFGLPVLEAMACGTAVMTSNTSSLPEVAGDAACLVDPNDTNAIAAGLERMLTDNGFRKGLAAKGPSRAAQFSWENAARKITDAAQK